MSSNQPPQAEETLDSRDVAELLARLLDKSLVMFEKGPDGGRFRLQELVREYGREVMHERGEGADIRRRHREHFWRLAASAEDGMSGPDQVEWRRRLEAEHDNLRAALEDALADPADSRCLAAEIAAIVWRFWYFRGYLAEGRRWLARALDRPDLPPDLRAKALNGAGALAREAGDYDAARALHEESLALFRVTGDERGLAAALGNLGNLALNQRDFGAAEALYKGSLALCRKLGDRRRAAYSLSNLGVVSRFQGDYARAWSLYEEALQIHQEIGNGQWQAITLSNLGDLAYFERKFEKAWEFQRESLRLRYDLGDRAGIAISLDDFAALLIADDSPRHGDNGVKERKAARLLGAAEAIRREIGGVVHEDDLADWERDVATVRERLGEDDFTREWSAGRRMTLADAVSEALNA